MYKLTAKINGVIIIWIYINCRIPIKTKLYIRIRMSWTNRIIISSLPIITTYISLLTHSPPIPAIIAIWYHIKTISKRYFLPIIISNSLRTKYIRRTSPATVILHSSIYIIWKLIINCNMIKLSYR